LRAKKGESRLLAPGHTIAQLHIGGGEYCARVSDEQAMRKQPAKWR
jgi:hypothetical protein